MLPEQFFDALMREFKQYFKWIFYSAILLCLVVLLVGFFWPKQFYSSTTIFADKKNIIRPLMEGVAENTEIINQNDAKEIIFSRKIMQKILDSGGWRPNTLSPVQQEQLIEAIKNRTLISLQGANSLRIEYHDDDAERAYRVTSKYAELFLDETIDNKKSESEQAYEFIDSQVSKYHQKLQIAEEKLKDFRTDNVDNRPGGEVQAFTHIADLRKELENTTLRLKEAQIRQASLSAQLRSEINQSEQAATASLYESKIRELQQQIDILRLTFHDTYPDIARLQQQIADMRKSIASAPSDTSVSEQKNSYKSLNDSPYYQKLRSDLAQTTTDIALNSTRINELQGMIANSRDRVASMSESQAEESELIRDYEVNKDLYQSLLRKRENARVSMNMDIDGRGLTFKIQEPANLPLLPSGLRFVHFLLLAPLLAMGFPLGLLVLKVQLDPRLRTISGISQHIELPLLITIPPASNSTNLTWLPSRWMMAAGILVLITAYAVLITAKLIPISTWVSG